MKGVRDYIHGIMRDERKGNLSGAARLALSALSFVYGILVSLNHFFYNAGILKRHEVPLPVISVGNITLGGTGKTPFVIMLAKRLARKGIKTAVLIRGYGEDEWKLLRDRLASDGVKVFVGRDRVKSAKIALREGFGAAVLDDGFQHRRLRRGLDIALLDAANPFGNRRLFPRGVLREPIANLRRADMIALTKIDKGRENVERIENGLKKIAPGKNIVKAFHRPAHLIDIKTGAQKDLSEIKGKPVCILSAICDPSYFRYTVEKAGATVAIEFIFPDHHLYKEGELDLIAGACKEKNIGMAITTEKDAVKLADLNLRKKYRGALYALSVELELAFGEELLDAEIDRLHMRSRSQGA